MTCLRDQIVAYVVACFRDMGANAKELDEEISRLKIDDAYLDQWASVTGWDR